MRSFPPIGEWIGNAIQSARLERFPDWLSIRSIEAGLGSTAFVVEYSNGEVWAVEVRRIQTDTDDEGED